MPRTATQNHRNVQRLSSAGAPVLPDVRGIEADRKRLRGKYPSPYNLRRFDGGPRPQTLDPKPQL